MSNGCACSGAEFLGTAELKVALAECKPRYFAFHDAQTFKHWFSVRRRRRSIGVIPGCEASGRSSNKPPCYRLSSPSCLLGELCLSCVTPTDVLLLGPCVPSQVYQLKQPGSGYELVEEGRDDGGVGHAVFRRVV